MSKFRLPIIGVPAIVTTVILAACGGGGGSTPATPPGITGVLASSATNVSFANTQVLFSCGCDGQAGSVTSDGAGGFALATSATAVPSSPSPTYTIVPGRNYVILGNQSNGTQAWTMEFLGNTPATNLNLYGASGLNTTDTYTAATSLYVFYQSRQFTGDQAYSRWNFNTLINWTNTLKASNGNNTVEKKYLADIAAQQAAQKSLFPVIPAWDPVASDSPNPTLVSDIEAVSTSNDTNLPTPCPTTGCVGAPAP